MLYQDLIRTEQWTEDHRLPPVLPIVLHNGVPRWNAPEEVSEPIVPAPSGLRRYRPYLRCFPLDEGCYRDSELASLRNLVAALFRLENSRSPAEVERILSSLVEWLQAPEQDSLRRGFTVWLKRVFLPGRMPAVEFDQVNDLQEVRGMLAERVVEWTEQWKRQGLEQGLEQGLRQGLEKGLDQGRREGEALFLLTLLEQRFGPLDDSLRQRVQAADARTLLEWGRRVLTAATPDEALWP